MPRDLAPALTVLAVIATSPVGAQNVGSEQVSQPAGTQLHEAPTDELEARGAELFVDASLGTTGMSCSTCHADFQSYSDTFKEPYPHRVQMGQDVAGLAEVNAAEMVQLCMVVPMGAEPLPWDSVELAALAAFVEAEQKRFAAR